ncbi:PASTA domain-containing protein, partial [Schaalia hyovaginalis]|uniref:PASTA domain-containing protein n=1 Tax=Schaalia hyovaginalis TaxID=29316 RepID=UPI002A74D774
VSIVEEYSDTLSAGGVLSSSPSSGSIVPQGSTVHLTVSKGPKPTSPSNNSGNSGSGNGNGNG